MASETSNIKRFTFLKELAGETARIKTSGTVRKNRSLFKTIDVAAESWPKS